VSCGNVVRKRFGVRLPSRQQQFRCLSLPSAEALLHLVARGEWEIIVVPKMAAMVSRCRPEGRQRGASLSRAPSTVLLALGREGKNGRAGPHLRWHYTTAGHTYFMRNVWHETLGRGECACGDDSRS
jgi:hypothetical protein